MFSQSIRLLQNRFVQSEFGLAVAVSLGLEVSIALHCRLSTLASVRCLLRHRATCFAFISYRSESGLSPFASAMAPPSAVWQYFSKQTINNKTFAKCSKCHLSLTYCGSTSTLIGHLRKVHQIEVYVSAPKRKRTANSGDNNKSEEEMDLASDSDAATAAFPLLPLSPRSDKASVRKFNS